MQRVLIFGATSAIAHAAARQWVARGAAVALIGRSPDKLQTVLQDLQVRASASGAAGPTQIHARQSDLDNVADHAGGISWAWQCLGEVDVVLMAQGSLPDQRACEEDPTLALAEFHTNGTAVAALCLQVANALMRQGHGTLAVISSVAGDRGRQSNFVYGAAKGMLSIFLQGLRNRCFAAGVHVLTIKPGFVDTPMTAAIVRKGALWATSEMVATGVLRAVDQRRNVAYLPGFWCLIMAIIRAVPEPLFKRLKL